MEIQGVAGEQTGLLPGHLELPHTLSRPSMNRLRHYAPVCLVLFSVAVISAQDRLAEKKLMAVPLGGDTIVYERVPENSGPWPTIDIYSVNEDGTNDKALTHDGHSHDPSWSPGGRHILFIHDAALQKPDPYGPYREHAEFKSHHAVELYEMNRDGSDPHLLKRFEPLIDGAAWSPDGKKIV